MKGDFTRDTFDESKQFTRVLSQQGRVEVDADLNEQTAILLHYLQALAADLIGPHGGPADIIVTEQGGEESLTKVNCGFEIIATEDRIRALPDSEDKEALINLLKQSNPQLLLGKGRYYVDGLLCENPSYRAFSNQPGYPFPDQPPPFAANQSYLVYLDIWERHLTYLEMEDTDGSVISIREAALNGSDTATRAQVVWQVRFKATGISVEDAKDYDKFLAELEDEIQPGTGQLRAQAIKVTSAPEDACITPPESRYRGAENQLYRVEIHNEGTAGNGATFKWSRENGSVIFLIRKIGTGSVTLYNLGRDERFGLKPGDWVEVVDDDYSLQNLSQQLLQVDTINYDDQVVTFKGGSATISQDVTKHAFLRRWDQRAANGVLEITESTTNWIDLEDGIQIQFQPGGTYQTGDYWLIPARTATGDVEWPGPKSAPEARPPHGIDHHYAPLWIISETSGSLTVDPDDDLRRQFKQLGLSKTV